MDVAMTLHQKIFALITALAVFALILELVRRRRLREEYSWLWLLLTAAMIVLVVWYEVVLFVTRLIGAVSPVTTLLLFASLCLLVIAVHYSVIISKLTTDVKNLAQEVALLADRAGSGHGG